MTSQQPQVQDILPSLQGLKQNIDRYQNEFETNQPFPYLRIEEFAESKFVTKVRDELLDTRFYEKNNDLYKFRQSGDLKSIESNNHIAQLRNAIFSEEFRSVVSQLTHIPLDSTVDFTASVYEQTDTLLCHDDRLDSRRIAFILYLVDEDWSAEDGGTLDLFDCDSAQEPVRISNRIVPKWNSMILFKVSEISHHQVAEVLSDSRIRITMGGWFHGPSIVDQSKSSIAPEYTLPRFIPNEFNDKLSNWLNPMYLDPSIRKQIRTQFAECSSIELNDFLKDEVYARVVGALSSRSEEEWNHVGPYNKRSYYTTAPHNDFLAQVKNLFTSIQFAEYLQHICDDLETVSHVVEMRRFSNGSYTLAYDTDPERSQPGLDVVFCMASDSWEMLDNSVGGELYYLDDREDEELLTVDCTPNTLSLVYRSEPGTSRFIKYINCKAPAPRYDLALTCQVEHKSINEQAA